MSQLTDKEIMNMSLEDAAAYTKIHPEEAWHFAKIHYSAALKQIKKAARHLRGGGDPINE